MTWNNAAAQEKSPAENIPAKVQLAIDDWKPYLSKDADFYGPVARIVKEAFAVEGVETEFVFRPWKRSLEESRSGKWHGSPTWYKTTEREKDFYYSAQPIMQVAMVLFHRKSYVFAWDTIDDLKGHRIEATVGFDYGKEFQDAEKNGLLNITRSNVPAEMMRRLYKGHVDLVLMDINVGHEAIREHCTPEEAAQLTYYMQPVKSDSGYLLLSKKAEGAAGLMELFDRGMVRLREGGQIDQYWEEAMVAGYKTRHLAMESGKDAFLKLQKDILEEKGLGKVQIANGEWTPYFSENLKHHGVVSRIVKEAFALEGIECEFVFRPWKRGMEDARKGKWHGTQGWGKKEEREKDFYYCDEPIMATVSALFHRKDKPFDWADFEDLKNLKIAGTAGYFYGEAIQKAEDEGVITIDRGPEDSLNFKKLLNGRADIAINDLEVGYELMGDIFTSEEMSKITHNPKNAGSFPCYLLLSKHVEGNAELVQIFNRGLKRLRESGKIDQYWEESRRGDYKISVKGKPKQP